MKVFDVFEPGCSHGDRNITGRIGRRSLDGDSRPAHLHSTLVSFIQVHAQLDYFLRDYLDKYLVDDVPQKRGSLAVIEKQTTRRLSECEALKDPGNVELIK